MSRTLWLTCAMADSRVSVYVASPDDPDLQVDGDAAEGVCILAEGLVLINEAVPVRRRLGVLIHELIHLASFLSGAKVTLRLSDDREEALVSAIAPMLTHALVGAGLLKGRRVAR